MVSLVIWKQKGHMPKRLLHIPRRRLLDIKTRNLDGTPTSEGTPGHGHGHEWSTHIPFVPCQSAPPPPTPTPAPPFFSISKFDPESYKTTRSKSWVRSKVNVIRFAQYPTNAPPFRFTSIGPTIPEICPIGCLTLKKHIRNFIRKFCKKRVSNRIPPKSNQVIGMNRRILLPHFVVISLVVLTLSCRQGYFCLSMSQSWPWLLKRFWREKQKSLRRRRRTNWKHKVTPD